jgi:hypothetical protein
MTLKRHALFAVLPAAAALMLGCGAKLPNTTDDGGTNDAGTEPTRPFEPGGATADEQKIDLAALFASIPAGTTWAALGADTKSQLQKATDLRLQRFASQWSADALTWRQWQIRNKPTDAFKAAFDSFTAATFANVVPMGFHASSDVANAALRQGLQDLFLSRVALGRSMAKFYGAADVDWDGSAFAEYPLPSRPALDAVTAFAAAARTPVAAIPTAGLSMVEAALVPLVLNQLQSVASGSVGSFGLGGDDLVTPYGRAAWGYDLMASNTSGEGNIYASSPADFLRDAVAYWMGPELERVNVGTVQSAVDFVLPQNAGADVITMTLGDPTMVPAAKAYLLLSQWWVERLKALPQATAPGYGLTDAEREGMWTSFQADSLVPPTDQTPLSGFNQTLNDFVSSQTTLYRQIATDAISQVFPGMALSDPTRASVMTAIGAQPTFGTLVPSITTALDTATGNTMASTQFNTALQGVGSIGGYMAGQTISAQDTATMAGMWGEVKAYIGRHYAKGPVKIATLLPDSLVLVPTGGSSTSPAGVITLSLELPTGLPSVYSTMLHEAKHAIDAKSGQSNLITGSAVEGAAEVVERRIAPLFLAEKFMADPKASALARLSLANRDTRYASRTEGMVAVMSAPSGADALGVCHTVAIKWGVSGAGETTLVQRAFYGTQYAGYLGGMVIYGAMLDYLQQQVAPPQGVIIDPYLLQEYGLETAGKDAASVAKLKMALNMN